MSEGAIPMCRTGYRDVFKFITAQLEEKSKSSLHSAGVIARLSRLPSS